MTKEVAGPAREQKRVARTTACRSPSSSFAHPLCPEMPHYIREPEGSPARDAPRRYVR